MFTLSQGRGIVQIRSPLANGRTYECIILQWVHIVDGHTGLSSFLWELGGRE